MSTREFADLVRAASQALWRATTSGDYAIVGKCPTESPNEGVDNARGPGEPRAMQTGNTMKAMSITGPGRIGVSEIERPVPRAGQIRIKVEGCGICASNLGPWQGLPWLSYPLPPAQGG